MTIRKVCVLGGTGFVGRHLCCELNRRGLQIRVLTRRRERRRELIVIPSLELVEADVHSVADLSVHMKGCDAVVNLIGILNEGSRPGQDFASVHGELPPKIAEACRYNRISRLLHMSALGASSDAPSKFLEYKAEGEDAVHRWADQGLHVTSFRPSVLFGPDDDFFNRFAVLLAKSPMVFPLACPNARMSPVYVEDVARVFADSLQRKGTYGQRYDLCGPKRYTLRELVEYTARAAGIKTRIVPLGDTLSRLQARVLEWVPGKPFSRDNYLSLQVEGVCENNGFTEFGVRPTSLECIVPSYIGHHGKMDFYRDLRRAAGR
ncbi:MAG: complex I NDUFA9 subunit family protein [Gammaproteobacteria bacterium]|nr:MAG: complex I NDUFA9 subunit family protein [Gammaproteobacteria bacterium]